MFVEDLSVFFNPAELGHSVTLGGVAVNAIFENGFMLGNASGIGIAAANPRLILPTVNVGANPVGLAVVANGLNYTVVEHAPDGTGLSELHLERVL